MVEHSALPPSIRAGLLGADICVLTYNEETDIMSINDNNLFGQLTLPEPEPTIDAATIKLNRPLAGFLAGYSGATLDAFRLDLRQWVSRLATFHSDPLAVERAHIELRPASAW